MISLLNFYLRHSVNDLRVNGRRTLFALLCIGAGVAAIVSLQTLGVMIEDTLSGSLRESNRGDIRVIPSFNTFDPDAPDLSDEEIAADGLVAKPAEDSEGGFRFTPQAQTMLQAWLAENYQGEVRLTYQQAIDDPTSLLSISVPARDSDKGLVIPIIIEAQEYPLFGAVETLEDQPLAEVLQNPTDIVLSQNLADDLGAELGDKVRLPRVTNEFTITGIVPTDAEGGLQNILASIFGYYYLDVSAMQYFPDVEPEAAAVIYIGLDNADLTVVDDLSEKLVEDYPYLTTVSTADVQEGNTLISNVLNQLVAIMGLVSMLIGGIGIVNTMLVIVSRRTTEVAVLKTLGMEPEQVTILFLVEAILMGILGSILGVLFGWLMAFALQSIPERVVAQQLTFNLTPEPAINGFIVGVIVTAIFGFIPILAAGQIRPAYVLRPSDTIIPQNGLLRTFAALMIIIFAITLLADAILGGLVNIKGDFQYVTAINGLIAGFLLAAPITLGGLLSLWQGTKGRSWLLYGFIWLVLLVGLPAGGAAFGYFFPSIMLVTVAFIMIASLYLLLLLTIWAVSGAPLSEFPVIGGLSMWLAVALIVACVGWVILTVFIVSISSFGTGLALFLGLLLPIHIPAFIVTLTIPAWILGQLFQRFGFLDLKISLRAMAASKSRGAITLLALVIGVFTLSTITMLVASIQNQLNDFLEDQTGGNVLIFFGGEDATLAQAQDILDNQEGVKSYGVLRSFATDFISMEDTSAEQTLTIADLEERIQAEYADSPIDTQAEDAQNELANTFSGIDARDLTGGLPRVNFYDGRQLDARQGDTEPDSEGHYPLVIAANDATLAAGIEVGDLLTFAINGDPTDLLTFRIVGMVDNRGGNAEGAVGDIYAPISAFGERQPDQVLIVADVEEDKIRELRRKLNELPFVFVIETSVINELFSSIIEQFTAFPRLVSALALFTGGVVIANSVALAMLERRREIAIMKAVGLQRERVLGMLLLENGIMGFLGGLLGVGMGVLILILLLVGLFQGELGDAIPIVPALLLMGLCVLISLVASIISVWGASGEKPLTVLRYE